MSDEIDCTLDENMESEMCMDMHAEEDHDMEGDSHEGSPMQANLKFLMTALFSFIGSALTYGRYRSADDFYTTAATYTGDYWEQANMVRHIPRAAIFGCLFILQALSMAGIANEINMMAWHYGMVFWMVTNMIANVLELLAYDSAYALYTADTTANATAATYMANVGFEQKGWLAKDTALVMGIVFAKKGWMKAQWSMLPEEKQMEMKGKKGDRKGDDMEEMMLSYYFGI